MIVNGRSIIAGNSGAVGVGVGECEVATVGFDVVVGFVVGLDVAVGFVVGFEVGVAVGDAVLVGVGEAVEVDG